TVTGNPGHWVPCHDDIDLGNSGTSMRLLLTVGAVGAGTYRFTGTRRMQERPVTALIEGLTQLGVPVRSINGDGCPPVEVTAGHLKGGRVSIDCSVSSQYLSSLLLVAPTTEQGMVIDVAKGPVSKPYIDMTLDIMEKMGITFQRTGYHHFVVSGGQAYRAGRYRVEPDASQASYFWAAGAITGKRVAVADLSRRTRQGDIRLLEVFETMGCRVEEDSDGGIALTGGELRGVDVDMGDMPDMVPTLAVVAAFAGGKTRIANVGHLRAKESDRLDAVATQLTRLGIEVSATDDSIAITGGRPKGALIDTYDDHRIAMAFGVAGLRVPGIVIRNENCVGKSFPRFWDVFGELYSS
ncbi:MAG: 3-phosphoshikimate 1-carboxyvinyltransferase, partial [Desulfobacterales bacterium]